MSIYQNQTLPPPTPKSSWNCHLKLQRLIIIFSFWKLVGALILRFGGFGWVPSEGDCKCLTGKNEWNQAPRHLQPTCFACVIVQSWEWSIERTSQNAQCWGISPHSKLIINAAQGGFTFQQARNVCFLMLALDHPLRQSRARRKKLQMTHKCLWSGWSRRPPRSLPTQLIQNSE